MFDPSIPTTTDFDVGIHWGPVCSRASDYGLMKIDDKGRVLYFNEKPRGADLESMVCFTQPLLSKTPK
jgi:ADP-glucose pyrophosphorylase